jgi:hypothetical protein
MYRTTDTFAHGEHVQALEGNLSCPRCHQDATAAKTRSGSRPCLDCHEADTNLDSRVRPTLDLPSGTAPGYRAAMHGLCVGCHRTHEEEKAIEEPYLSRCTACHRDPTGVEREELRPRAERTLTARLELP